MVLFSFLSCLSSFLTVWQYLWVFGESCFCFLNSLTSQVIIWICKYQTSHIQNQNDIPLYLNRGDEEKLKQSHDWLWNIINSRVCYLVWWRTHIGVKLCKWFIDVLCYMSYNDYIDEFSGYKSDCYVCNLSCFMFLER